MRILAVREVIEFLVETDDEEWDTYRTDGRGNWELLMGSSWEDYFSEDIQKAWEEYMA